MSLKATLALTTSLLIFGGTAALAQDTYELAQIRVVRQIASARAMANLCHAKISPGRTASALRSVGLSENDLQRRSLQDELAKQRIALLESYEALAMTNVGRREALNRQCTSLDRLYGPRGTIIPGLAIVPR